jgi:hypothetical protein
MDEARMKQLGVTARFDHKREQDKYRKKWKHQGQEYT